MRSDWSFGQFSMCFLRMWPLFMPAASILVCSTVAWFGAGTRTTSDPGRTSLDIQLACLSSFTWLSRYVSNWATYLSLCAHYRLTIHSSERAQSIMWAILAPLIWGSMLVKSGAKAGRSSEGINTWTLVLRSRKAISVPSMKCRALITADLSTELTTFLERVKQLMLHHL